MPVTLPFFNTLKADDRIWDVEFKRGGRVVATPRHRNTRIVFDGVKTPTYRDVTMLRFIPPTDGNKRPDEIKPELEAPYEGELPPLLSHVETIPKTLVASGNLEVLASLKKERADLEAEIAAMTERAKVCRARIEKLHQAIAVLSS